MAKSKKKKKETNELKEPVVGYGHNLVFFNSFEEQEEYELREMALLSPLEILQQMRKFINLAYGMHGYDPKNLPKKHFIKFPRRKLK